MNWRAGAIATGTIVLLVGACLLVPPDSFHDDPPPAPTLPENTWVEHLPIDGMLVTCIFRSSYGISCDWANARPLDAGSTTQPIAPPPLT